MILLKELGIINLGLVKTKFKKSNGEFRKPLSRGLFEAIE